VCGFLDRKSTQQQRPSISLLLNELLLILSPCCAQASPATLVVA